MTETTRTHFGLPSSTFTFQEVAAALQETVLSETLNVSAAAGSALAANADAETRTSDVRIRRFETSLIFAMSLFVTSNGAQDNVLPEHLLEGARVAFPERQELHERPPHGTPAELEEFASEYFHACFPTLRELAFGGLGSKLLLDVFGIEMPQMQCEWHSLFAGRLDGELIDMSEPNNVDFLVRVRKAAKDPLNVAACVIILPILGVFARHSQFMREKLAADLEFLDLIAVRISDACKLLALGLEIDADSQTPSVMVAQVALLSAVVSESPVSWARHVSRPDRRQQCLPTFSDDKESLTSQLRSLETVLKGSEQSDIRNGLARALCKHIGVFESALRLEQRSSDDAETDTRKRRREPDVCDNCGNAGRGEGTKLTPCIRCQNVWYCSWECERAGWDKGHKADCF